MQINGQTLITGLGTKISTIHGLDTYCNLDNAATTPPLRDVMIAINNFMPWYGSVHRGNGYKSRVSTQQYERAHDVVRDFVGANADDHVVILVKNTTEAINKLSYRIRLRKSDIVLISHLEHHSNDLPWRARATVKRIDIQPDGTIDRKNFEQLLHQYGRRIKLVALTGASNVTGHMPDIHWFARKAHDVGAEILIDCAQLAAHRPIAMKPLTDPEHLDYVAFSGHKLYAPFGSGALIGRRDTFTHGSPEYTGGGTIISVTTKTIDWAEPPESEEAGSPNVVGAVALTQAIRTITDVGLPRIAAYESSLTAYALRHLKRVPGLTIFGETDPKTTSKRAGVIPFTIKDMPAQLVAACLGYEWGIGVRSGCFCAQPYVMSLLGVNPFAVRNAILHHQRDAVPGLVRISFGLYNTTDDIDRLVRALFALSRGWHATYAFDPRSGMYTPEDLKENFSDLFITPGSAVQ